MIDVVDREPVDPCIVDVLKFRKVTHHMECVENTYGVNTTYSVRVSENVQTYVRSVIPQLTNYGNIMRDFVHTLSLRRCMDVQQVDE